MDQVATNHWEAVGCGLQVRIRAPSTVQTDGETFVADAHFLDFGGEKGMLVFHDFSHVQSKFQSLVGLGYGITSIAAPDGREPLDIHSWHETLADWTWTGSSETRPGWLSDFEN